MCCMAVVSIQGGDLTPGIDQTTLPTLVDPGYVVPQKVVDLEPGGGQGYEP
jgi:hypothetical protein